MVLAGDFYCLSDTENMISSIFSFFSGSQNDNHRIVPRYGVGNLKTWIQKPGLLGLYESHVELLPIDFNQTGMAFHHEHLLIPGQTVVLDLKKDGCKLASIVAIVRYTSQHADHYRSGVEFNFDANDHMGSMEVKRTLNDIESSLIETPVG